MAEVTLAQVCRRLDRDPDDLAGAAQLPDDAAARLAVLLNHAIDARDRQLREAVEASLEAVPRPLRGVVARMVRR